MVIKVFLHRFNKFILLLHICGFLNNIFFWSHIILNAVNSCRFVLFYWRATSWQIILSMHPYSVQEEKPLGLDKAMCSSKVARTSQARHPLQ